MFWIQVRVQTESDVELVASSYFLIVDLTKRRLKLAKLVASSSYHLIVDLTKRRLKLAKLVASSPTTWASIWRSAGWSAGEAGGVLLPPDRTVEPRWKYWSCFLWNIEGLQKRILIQGSIRNIIIQFFIILIKWFPFFISFLITF